ncbi:hypothetical protein QM012_006229 [Aureobasidium pullulans]|uniref:Uncharacterized protein n=1 Tax=Aureobasidium pullulans TaxID=5580 RepID=A0ABR0TTN9_AURPU
MAAVAAEAQRLRDAIHNLEVGRRPPRDFPGRLSAPVPPSPITLNERQNQRFTRNKFLAEVAGVTTADAVVGSGRAVIARAGSTEVNFYCLSEGTEGVLEAVDQDHIAFSHQDTNLRAWNRLSQVNALTSAEADGLITHAEADMAARHIGAYKAALRICQQNDRYRSGGMISALTLEAVDAREHAHQLLLEFNDMYQAELEKDVFAHAISFYNTHRLEFPQEFDEDQHMDWFIVWYRDQVWNATLERIDTIEPRVMIANVERVLRGQRRSGMVLRSAVVTRNTLNSARWTSEIAMNDARPAIYAGDASRSSPWEDLQRLDFIENDGSDEDRLRSVSFTDRVVPHDVSHWREWSPVFWSDHRPPRLDVFNNIRPSVLTLSTARAAEAIIQYKRYEKSFEKWSEDVVAFLVYKEMRSIAEQADIISMARRFRLVSHMMRGGSARTVADDDEEDENSSESENSNKSGEEEEEEEEEE